MFRKQRNWNSEHQSTWWVNFFVDYFGTFENKRPKHKNNPVYLWHYSKMQDYFKNMNKLGAHYLNGIYSFLAITVQMSCYCWTTFHEINQHHVIFLPKNASHHFPNWVWRHILFRFSGSWMAQMHWLLIWFCVGVGYPCFITGNNEWKHHFAVLESFVQNDFVDLNSGHVTTLFRRHIFAVIFKTMIPLSSLPFTHNCRFINHNIGTPMIFSSWACFVYFWAQRDNRNLYDKKPKAFQKDSTKCLDGF